MPIKFLGGPVYEPLTVHPWLAVVAITMIPIRKRTTNARWAPPPLFLWPWDLCCEPPLDWPLDWPCDLFFFFDFDAIACLAWFGVARSPWFPWFLRFPWIRSSRVDRANAPSPDVLHGRAR